MTAAAVAPVRAGAGAMPSAGHVVRRILIYGALIFWAFVSLFPIYWTVTTSMKVAIDVTQGHLIPWVDFTPSWKGWRSLGLSPDTLFQTSTVREEFLKRFANSIITSVGGSALAIVIGSLEGKEGKGYIQRDTDGKLNLARITKAQPSAPAPARPAAATP